MGRPALPCLVLSRGLRGSWGGWGGLRGVGCGGLEGLRLREDLLRETEGVVVGSIFCLNPQHLDQKKSSIIISIWSQSSSRKGVFRVMKLSLRSYICFLHETPSKGLFYHILYYKNPCCQLLLLITPILPQMQQWHTLHLGSVHLLAQNALHSHMPFKITNKTPQL